MNTVTLELPADTIAALRLPRGEEQARLRRELAVRLYEKGLLSFGKSRELAGLTKWQFHELLAQEQIPRRYDVEDLDGDVQALESLD